MDVLIFKMQNSFYGFDLAHVVNTMMMDEVQCHPMPSVADYIKGLMFYKGNVVPIVQVGLEPPRKIILFQLHDVLHALAVEDLLGVYNMKEQVLPLVFKPFNLSDLLGESDV